MSNEQIFNSGRAVGKTEEKADHMKDKTLAAVSNATEATQQKGAEAMSKASDAMDSVKSTSSDAMGAVKSKAADAMDSMKRKKN